MQSKEARPLRWRPFGVVGQVMPLPHGLELGLGEVVATVVWRGDWPDAPRVGLHPCRWRAGKIARQSKIRPAILPHDWGKRGVAADAVVVPHGQTPPLSGDRVDNAALMQ